MLPSAVFNSSPSASCSFPICYFSSYLITFIISAINQADGSNYIIQNINNSSKIEFDTFSCTYQIYHPCNDTDKIRFIFYPGGSTKSPVNLDVNKRNTPLSFNRALQLKVIIHGFGSNRYVASLIKAYMTKRVHNILFVDWEPLSKRPCYLSAKINTWQVGRCTSLALHQLVPTSYVHVIGFSLGAHVAGYVSNYLGKYFGRKANRITGLDPALPLYVTPLEEFKLDKSDADFVDAVHTSSGVFGKIEPSGHQDFYINDYPIQPGCFNDKSPILCSHVRSVDLFAESIASETGFWGAPCNSIWHYIVGYCERFTANGSGMVLMGEYTDKRMQGVFYVRTADSPPYALGLSEFS